MKKKFLLPILLLATLTMGGAVVACNPNKNNQPSDQDGSNYGVTINNKTALGEDWYQGENRDLDVTLTPEANALLELNSGALTVTSSNTSVVSVSGLGLSALAEGQAKITVSYHGAKDEIDITILSKSAKKKYNAAHEGTAEDPFTNEDALLVAAHEKYAGEVYYVKGIVDRFYYAPGANEKNGVAYYLKAATEGGEQFEIFKCFKEDGSQLTDDDIWVGGEATAYGAFTKYNSQYETSSAKFVSCTGNKPQPRQTLTKTFAETLAYGVSLKDGESSWDYYKFQGYVTTKSGNDYFLTATKGEALVAGKSDAAHGEKDIKGTNAIELFGAGKVAALAAKLLEGAKVEVTMIVKNYHGTVENGLDLKDADVTVLEAGKAWAVPEPAVANKTVTEFVALENNKKNAYSVKATIKAWKGDAADQYGNMTITDGTTDLVIYGASATATALAWDGAGEYAFTNPKDFLTNDVTKALKIGDEITMKLIRADYTKDGNTTIQGTGVITAVTAPDAPKLTLVEKFDFTSTLTAYEQYNAEKMNAFIKGSSSLGANTNYVDHVNGKDTDNSLTDPLIGANGSISGTAWKNYNNLKLGSTSKNAKMTLNFKDGTAISKVVMKVAGWPGKTCKLGVNGGTQQSIKSATTAASLEDETAFLTYEFELAEPAKSLVLDTTLAVMISEMELYAAEASGQQSSNITFKWGDVIQSGSSALDGAKFNKNATYNLKIDNVPAAGTYVLTLPMMGSDGNATRTFCTTGTDHDGQGFSIAVGETAGTILVANKTYAEVFGSSQTAWVNVAFAEVTLAVGSNVIKLTTNGGGYRVSVNVNSDITLAPKAAA